MCNKLRSRVLMFPVSTIFVTMAAAAPCAALGESGAILKERIHRLTGMEHFTDQAMNELMNLPVESVSILTSM